MSSSSSALGPPRGKEVPPMLPDMAKRGAASSSDDAGAVTERTVTTPTASSAMAAAWTTKSSLGSASPCPGTGASPMPGNVEQRFEQDFSKHLKKSNKTQRWTLGAVGAGVGGAIGVAASPVLLPGIVVAGLVGAGGGYMWAKRWGKQELQRQGPGLRSGGAGGGIEEESTLPGPPMRRLRYLVKWGHWQLLEYEDAPAQWRCTVLDEILRNFSPWIQRMYLLAAKGQRSEDDPEAWEVFQHLAPLYYWLQRRAAVDTIVQASQEVLDLFAAGSLDDASEERCAIAFPTVLETISTLDRLSSSAHQALEREVAACSTTSSASGALFADVEKRRKRHRLRRIVEAIRTTLERQDLQQALADRRHRRQRDERAAAAAGAGEAPAAVASGASSASAEGAGGSSQGGTSAGADEKGRPAAASGGGAATVAAASGDAASAPAPGATGSPPVSPGSRTLVPRPNRLRRKRTGPEFSSDEEDKHPPELVVPPPGVENEADAGFDLGLDAEEYFSVSGESDNDDAPRKGFTPKRKSCAGADPAAELGDPGAGGAADTAVVPVGGGAAASSSTAKASKGAGDDLPTSRYKQRAEALPFGDIDHTWNVFDPSSFDVRSKSYLKDRRKEPSGDCLLELVSVDFTRVGQSGPVWRATEHPDFYPAQHRAKGDGRFLLVMNWVFPPFQCVICAALDDKAPWMRDALSPQARLWRKFLNSDNERRKDLFKIIVSLEKGPWLVRKSVPKKPVLIGQKVKMQSHHEEGRHLEITLDVASSRAEQVACAMVIGALRKIELVYTVLIEAREEEELPESLLVTALARNWDPSRLWCPEEPEALT